ncbi:MAG: TIGR04086 family membrane protein [Bacilli bacterium]|nr:TIGR04086 family membrane protein [Bacilli bacterium]
MLKNYLKSYLYLFSIILVLTIILSLINYYITIPTKIIKLLIPIISIFISSTILGKNVKEKAYLEGLKFTSIYLFLSIIISIITKNPFTLKLIISYLSLLLSGIIGSMLGINIKKNHN